MRSTFLLDRRPDVFDFNKNAYPYLSVYDAGGKDTIDLSGFNVSQFLDL